MERVAQTLRDRQFEAGEIDGPPVDTVGWYYSRTFTRQWIPPVSR
jgi:hypothetical protein